MTETQSAVQAPENWSLDQIIEGMQASFSRCVEAADVDAFARLSGDRNPLHMDSEFAKQQGFRERVVHGALLCALASQLVGMHLPGRRAFLLSLDLKFKAPTFPGDVVDVVGTVSSVHPEPRVIVLAVSLSCGSELRAAGKALVRIASED